MGRACSLSAPGSRLQRSRKILCISVLGLALAPGAGSAPGAGRANLVRASLSQAGRSLIATIRTSRSTPLGRLDPLPNQRAAGSAYLCVELQRRRRGGGRRLCVGGADPHRRIGLELVNAAGRTTAKRTVAATVRRPGAGKLVLSLVPGAAGLSPHRYRWRVLSGDGRCGEGPGSCGEALPAQGSRGFRLRPVRAVGCTGGAPVLDTNGPRDRRVVALTFDDGPSAYTPAFLDVLRSKHVEATFFEIGQEMPGREETMRRILREGSEIGNHTMHHAAFPGYAEIAGASSLVESATHFRPCLFRPPGGGVDSAVTGTAGALGMRTVTWDVDPSDWSNPGSGTVYGRVVEGVQPGSIVVMHDGGGDRGGTLAALPSIIDTLRARGYGFATVSELLGNRLIYRPYG
jgi:peptidoglycan/xylan/chitin deacetylase (PgdA/CDA1 family)